MGVTYLEISYPNFVLGSIIDPEEANQNNYDIVTKINGIVDAHNLSEENITNLGSDKASVIYVDEQNINLAGAGRTIQTIKANFDAMVAHKISVDHDGRYYTKTLLDGGQLDNRYFTKGQLSPFMAGSTVPIYTDKYTITSSDNGNGTFSYLRGGVANVGSILNGDTQVITIEGNTYRKDINGLMVYVDGVLFTSINGNELIELTDTTFGLKPIQPSDVIITIKYINKDGILAIDNVMQQLANIEATSLQLQDEISDSIDEVELMLDSKADVDITGNVPVEQLENVRDMKDFYGREVKQIKIEGANQYDSSSVVDFNLLDAKRISTVIAGNYYLPDKGYVPDFDLVIIEGNSTNARVATTLSPISNLNLAFESYNNTLTTITSKPFDLTNVNSIELDYIAESVSSGSCTIGFVKDKNQVVYDKLFELKNTSRGVVSLDTSELNGEYYLKIKSQSNTGISVKLRIYSFWFKGLNTEIVNNNKLQIKPNVLEATFSKLFEMPSHFIDWYNLNALVDTPPNTSVRFDIYDKYDSLLKADVKQGDILKLTEPIIKPRVTLSRGSLETPSPVFSWLEIGMRGLGDSTLLFGRDVKRYEFNSVNDFIDNQISTSLLDFKVVKETPSVINASALIEGTILQNLAGTLTTLNDVANSKQIRVRNSNTGYAYFRTANKISVTNLKSVIVKFNTNCMYGKLGVAVVDVTTDADAPFFTGLPGSSYANFDGVGATVIADTSNITGDKYIIVRVKVETSTAHDIYIEDIIFMYDNEYYVPWDRLQSVIRLNQDTLSLPINLLPLTIPPNFSEWHGLNALTDTPPGTKVRFDIYDKYGNLLEDDIKNGEKFKNFTYPEIYPRVTLSRDSLETPSPTFSWLEIGWLGSNAGMKVWKPIDKIALDVNTVQLDIATFENYRELRLVGRNITTTTTISVLLALNNIKSGGLYLETTIKKAVVAYVPDNSLELTRSSNNLLYPAGFEISFIKVNEHVFMELTSTTYSPENYDKKSFARIKLGVFPLSLISIYCLGGYISTGEFEIWGRE